MSLGTNRRQRSGSLRGLLPWSKLSELTPASAGLELNLESGNW